MRAEDVRQPACGDPCPLLPSMTPALSCLPGPLPSSAFWVPSAYSEPGPCLFTADLLALWARISPLCRWEPPVLGQSERPCVAPSKFGCKWTGSGWPDEWPRSHRGAVKDCREGDRAPLAHSAASASCRGWMAMCSMRTLVI